MSLSPSQIFYPTRILSSANSADVIAWVQNNLEQGKQRLLINFQDVLFMDSTGLATLVDVKKMISHVGGQLALCCLGGQARMLFEMSGMEGFFEIYDNPQEFEQATSSGCTTTQH
jgi:anti-sigma B factor antagonist